MTHGATQQLDFHRPARPAPLWWALKSIVQSGHLKVRDWRDETHEFGDNTGKLVAVHFRDAQDRAGAAPRSAACYRRGLYGRRDRARGRQHRFTIFWPFLRAISAMANFQAGCGSPTGSGYVTRALRQMNNPLRRGATSAAITTFRVRSTACFWTRTSNIPVLTSQRAPGRWTKLNLQRKGILPGSCACPPAKPCWTSAADGAGYPCIWRGRRAPRSWALP